MELFGGGDKFRKRSEEALARRKLPSEELPPIPLPPPESIKGADETIEVADTSPDDKKQYFVVMPGEVPEAPEGGDFIVDTSADTSAPGVFSYKGNVLRPVTPAEYSEITAITANADTRRQKGAQRLAALEAQAAPKNEVAPEREPIKSGDGGYTDGANSPEREAERQKAMRGLLVKNGVGFQLIHHSGNTTGRGETGEDYYVHPEMPDEKFSKEEMEAALAAKTARLEATPGKVARDAKKKGPEADAEKPNWDVKISAFRGLKPKQFDTLIHGPDQLGFSMLVESLDPGALEIKRKLQEGILISKDEEKILNYARYEYTRRMQQVEFIYGKLNVADLEVAGRHNEDFAALLQFRGTGRTLELFKKQVLQMGMKNKEALDALYNTYENLTHLRDKTVYKVWEKGVQDLCARRGITMDDYDATFKTGTKEQRVATRREIQEEIRHGWGPFRRVLDKATGTSFRRADRMVRRATRFGEAVRDLRPIREVHDEMDSLTNILKFTMVDNDEVRLLIQQEAVSNQNLNTSAENVPLTFDDAQKAETKSAADMRTAFDKVVRDFKTKDGRDWDHATVDERTEGLGPLRNARAKEERQSGQGWFARACLAIARAAFGQKEEEIINKPTLK